MDTSPAKEIEHDGNPKQENLLQRILKKLDETGSLSVVYVGLFYFILTIFYFFVEGWGVLETLYYLTVTISTVGYGDVTPKTQLGRFVTIFTILIGIASVFTVIGSFASKAMSIAQEVLLEKAQTPIDSQIDQLEAFKVEKEKMDADNKVKISVALGSMLLVIFVGTIFYKCNVEDLTWIDALYLCIVTSSTVGYGDISLSTKLAWTFSIFYISISVVVIAASVTTLATIKMERDAWNKKVEALSKPLDYETLIALGQGKGIRRDGFVLGMLVLTGVVDKEKDLGPWQKRFDEIDKDGNGRLDGKDVAIFLTGLEEKQAGALALYKKYVQDFRKEVAEAETKKSSKKLTKKLGHSKTAKNVENIINKGQKLKAIEKVSQKKDSTKFQKLNEKSLLRSDLENGDP